MHSHEISGIESVSAFVLAGRAIFTMVNDKTGNRFTFRVSVCKNNGTGETAETAEAPAGPFFVKVLTGPDNTANYEFLGTIFVQNQDGTACPPRFWVSPKSRISWDAPSAKAMRWLVEQMAGKAEFPLTAHLLHEGRCGRCGRLLTVPSSIESGLGPVCAGRA